MQNPNPPVSGVYKIGILDNPDLDDCLFYVNVEIVNDNPKFIIYDIIDSVSGKIVRNDGSLSDATSSEVEDVIYDLFINIYPDMPVPEFRGSINYSGQKASYILNP